MTCQECLDFVELTTRGLRGGHYEVLGCFCRRGSWCPTTGQGRVSPKDEACRNPAPKPQPAQGDE